MTRTEGISPWKSNKDAVPASCILPGRAPNHTISQKNDAVESFYLLSRLGIFVFRNIIYQSFSAQIVMTRTEGISPCKSNDSYRRDLPLEE